MNPKTIITYLVDGDPAGVKTVELSNWVGKSILVPRAKLKDMKDRQELNQPAIYFLFGKSLDNNDYAYIGEAENLFKRLVDHDTKKDFWDLVIAFVSKNNDLSKGDIKYLESKSIERAKAVNRYMLDNTVTPSANVLPEYQIATMNEFFDNMNLLISAMGYPILEKVELKNNINIKTYYCKGPNADAKGTYLSDGLLVYKGSKSRVELTNTAGDWIKNIQSKLLSLGVIENFDGKCYIFKQDYLFSSPSAASGLILSRRSNGWEDWKDEKGNTLDKNERQSLKI